MTYVAAVVLIIELSALSIVEELNKNHRDLKKIFDTVCGIIMRQILAHTDVFPQLLDAAVLQYLTDTSCLNVHEVTQFLSSLVTGRQRPS